MTTPISSTAYVSCLSRAAALACLASLLWLSGCVPRDQQTTPAPEPSTNTTAAHVSPTRTLPVALAQPAGAQAAQPAVALDPLDWPYWRGPEYNGISRETGLLDDFDPQGGPDSNVAWKREDLGGRSTPVVMAGRLYTLVRAEPGTAREGEKVVCVDALTGETLWENRFNVYLSDVPDTRVGWSSVVADAETGNVYAQGVSGHFLCIDAQTGETRWEVPLHERFGALSTYGGRTNFPVIHEDLVIVSAVVIGWGEMAKPAHRFIAMDKRTGEVVWISSTRLLPYDTTYSSPSLSVLGGQSALVFGSGDGAVWAFQPRTGRPLWQFELSRRGLNAPPLVVGNRVFTGHSEENLVGTTMGAMVAIDAGQTRPPQGATAPNLTNSAELWRIDELVAGRTQPLQIGNRIWVFDDRAKLFILDADNGQQIARLSLGRMMRSSPLYADGKVYAASANGRWAIYQPDEQQGARVVSRGRLPSGEEVHGSFICSHGRVYLPSTGALYCLYDASKEPGATPRPASAEEIDRSKDTEPAYLQLVPADVLMQPGQTQQFQCRLYNAYGQLLGTVDQPTLTVEGSGSIASDGQYTAAENAKHEAVTIHAQVGQLKNSARIRVVPPLPWEFDFEPVTVDPKTGTGEPPVTWVGARYRHVVRNEDGNQVMVKVTTIPKGTRSRAWMGPSDLHDYTIQADVRGAIQDGKMPDIGLIAQGYTLDLQGASQKLQIRSWYPQLRMAQTVNFSWEPDRWYTMKLRAAIEDDKAVLRGKVWPKDQPEPEDWTVEAVDEAPNRRGSPGLFGNAKDAEIFLDNIRVMQN